MNQQLPIAAQYPSCYPTLKSYSEWRQAARVADEPCTPCDDCTGRYASLMKAQGRCDKSAAAAFGLVGRPKNGKKP